MRAFLYSILVLIGYVAMPSHAATYYGGLCGAGGGRYLIQDILSSMERV